MGGVIFSFAVEARSLQEITKRVPSSKRIVELLVFKKTVLFESVRLILWRIRSFLALVHAFAYAPGMPVARIMKLPGNPCESGVDTPMRSDVPVTSFGLIVPAVPAEIQESPSAVV